MESKRTITRSEWQTNVMPGNYKPEAHSQWSQDMQVSTTKMRRQFLQVSARVT